MLRRAELGVRVSGVGVKIKLPRSRGDPAPLLCQEPSPLTWAVWFMVDHQGSGSVGIHRLRKAYVAGLVTRHGGPQDIQDAALMPVPSDTLRVTHSLSCPKLTSS